VRKLTRKLEVTRDKIASWPSDKLQVYSEQSSIFYDIMTNYLVDQVPPPPTLPSGTDPYLTLTARICFGRLQ